MNMLSGAPGSPVGPVDIKDPRIRVTFADVAMRVASDGPMYGVIVLVGVLALRGTTSALESILGAAFALQARSSPPPVFDKLGGVARAATSAVVAVALFVALHLLQLAYRAPDVRALVANVVK